MSDISIIDIIINNNTLDIDLKHVIKEKRRYSYSIIIIIYLEFYS